MTLSRTTLLAALPAAVLTGALLCPTPASAQGDTPAPEGASAADRLQQSTQDLEAARAEQKKTAETEKQLRAEIEQFADDRKKFNTALIDNAAKVREIEHKIGETEARLKPLEDDEQRLRRSLETRRETIAEILAALQRIGRRPPPAIMLRPDDALLSLRTAMMLGTVLPDMREKARALALDLDNLLRLRTQIGAERTQLANDLATLETDRRRMALLIEERQKQQASAEKSLDAERQRANALARQVDNLQDLIASLEKGAAGPARPADEPKADSRAGLAALKDPGRLAPAIAFASARGLLPMPANGVRIKDFGGPDGLGGTEKGITLATRPGAQVTSPCDGWVVYAGPFRSYGQLLILNTGGGYHVLLAGMERISVDLGQFVLTGEPVAVMGNRSQIAAAAPIGSSQPTLYIEFRKDGIPVDSGPWWVTGEGEKVRG